MGEIKTRQTKTDTGYTDLAHADTYYQHVKDTHWILKLWEKPENENFIDKNTC